MVHAIIVRQICRYKHIIVRWRQLKTGFLNSRHTGFLALFLCILGE
jgi:hypothetical protein